MTEISGGNLSKNFVVVASTQPSSPFEGQIWVDSDTNETYQYKGGSFQEITLDGDALKERHLELVADIAEARYGASVVQEDMDDVIYDIFADEAKITSKNGVTISTLSGGDSDGKAELSNVSTDAPSGYDSQDDFSFDVNLKAKGIITHVGVENRSGSSSADATVEIKDSDGNVLASKTKTVSFNGNESFAFSEGDYSSLPDSNETITVSISGGGLWSHNTGVSKDNDVYSISSDNFPSADKTSGYTALKVRITSGSLTSDSKSLGFTPSKVLVNHEADISSDEDIQYVVSDNSGNSKTVTSGEIGSSVTVSFDDGDITVKPELSTSNGNTTPTLYEYGVLFV